MAYPFLRIVNRPQHAIVITYRRRPKQKGRKMGESGINKNLIVNSRTVTMFSMALIALVISLLYENPFLNCDKNSCHLNLKLFSHIALEISFALFIALAVTIGIEHHSRQADLQAHDNMRRGLAEDVFRGVFSKELPPAYVEAIIGGLLKIETIREYIRIFDKIEPFEEDDRKIVLTRKLKYLAKNISYKNIIYPVRFYFHSDDIDDFNSAKLLSLKINGETLSQEEIDKCKTVNVHAGQISYEFLRDIPRDGSLEVEYDIVILKQGNDTEVFSALDPSMKLSYCVRASVPLKRLGLKERSVIPATTQVYDLAAGIGDWEIDGPFLKDNSIAVWWSRA